MPNTLAHMGVARLTSLALFRDADAKWIYIGCVIPDIPWIIQRLVASILPGTNLLDLRLYVIIQASLFFSLVFSAAVSLIFKPTLRIFLLLGFNCLIHLLLDAVQIKWANGVHFLVPLSWQMKGFGIFWPENLFSYFLTGFGLIMVLWYWQDTWRRPVFLSPPSFIRIMASTGLLIVYFSLPFFFFDGPEQLDNHYISTLRHRHARPHRSIAFDRCYYDPDTQAIRIFSGEVIKVSGIKSPRAATVSIKGRFVTTDRIKVQVFHIHYPFRDAASLLGLALITILWFTAGWGKGKSPGILGPGVDRWRDYLPKNHGPH